MGRNYSSRRKEKAGPDDDGKNRPSGRQVEKGRLCLSETWQHAAWGLSLSLSDRGRQAEESDEQETCRRGEDTCGSRKKAAAARHRPIQEEDRIEKRVAENRGRSRGKKQGGE